jgi:hypothetical protein
VLPELSVVIPVLNEAPNLEALYQQFSAALEATARPYELIIIDDGSTDRSYEVLKGLQARDPHLRVIRFRRNFGQTAAFAAGIAAARGGLMMLDLLTVKFLLNYSMQPLRVFGAIGGLMGVVGIVLLGALGALRLLHRIEIGDHLPLTLFGILVLFSGIQLVTLGLLAELQVRVYQESQNRPVYVIRDVLETT